MEITKTNKFLSFSLLLVLLGIADTLYLTWEHYANIVPPCPAHSVLGSWVDCGRVLTSSYSTIFNIPLALYGLGYYLFLIVSLNFFKKFLPIIVTFGLGFSLYLIYIQVFALRAICLYCTFSGVINLLLFIVTWSPKLFSMSRQKNSSTI